MGFKVFLSHATGDIDLAREISKKAASVGAEVFIAEEDKRPGTPILQKVEENLRTSHALVVLLTRKGHASAYVQNEIGWARGAGKPIIALKHKSVDPSKLGMLDGLEYIPFDKNLAEATTELVAHLCRLIKTENDRAALFGIFMIFLLVLVGRSGD